MNLGLSGKTAVVTGAGRGLGEDICRRLAGEGARVFALSRTQSDLEKLVTDMGGEADGHRFAAVDLAAEDGPAQAIAAVEAAGVTPDILVNNVGGNLGYTDPLGPVDEWRRVMRLNVEIAIELNAAFIPPMRAKKWGRVVHVSSIVALDSQGPQSRKHAPPCPIFSRAWGG